MPVSEQGCKKLGGLKADVDVGVRHHLGSKTRRAQGVVFGLPPCPHLQKSSHRTFRASAGCGCQHLKERVLNKWGLADLQVGGGHICAPNITRDGIFSYTHTSPPENGRERDALWDLKILLF